MYEVELKERIVGYSVSAVRSGDVATVQVSGATSTEDGDLQILWCGEDVSGESWGAIMKQIFKGKEKTGITLTESVMVEAFPGASAEVSKEDIENNKGAPLPDLDKIPDYIKKGE